MTNYDPSYYGGELQTGTDALPAGYPEQNYAPVIPPEPVWGGPQFQQGDPNYGIAQAQQFGAPQEHVMSQAEMAAFIGGGLQNTPDPTQMYNQMYNQAPQQGNMQYPQQGQQQSPPVGVPPGLPQIPQQQAPQGYPQQQNQMQQTPPAGYPQPQFQQAPQQQAPQALTPDQYYAMQAQQAAQYQQQNPQQFPPQYQQQGYPQQQYPQQNPAFGQPNQQVPQGYPQTQAWQQQAPQPGYPQQQNPAQQTQTAPNPGAQYDAQISTLEERYAAAGVALQDAINRGDTVSMGQLAREQASVQSQMTAAYMGKQQVEMYHTQQRLGATRQEYTRDLTQLMSSTFGYQPQPQDIADFGYMLDSISSPEMVDTLANPVVKDMVLKSYAWDKMTAMRANQGQRQAPRDFVPMMGSMGGAPQQNNFGQGVQQQAPTALSDTQWRTFLQQGQIPRR